LPCNTLANGFTRECPSFSDFWPISIHGSGVPIEFYPSCCSNPRLQLQLQHPRLEGRKRYIFFALRRLASRCYRCGQLKTWCCFPWLSGLSGQRPVSVCYRSSSTAPYQPYETIALPTRTSVERIMKCNSCCATPAPIYVITSFTPPLES
jgi:hypothetical protein